MSAEEDADGAQVQSVHNAAGYAAQHTRATLTRAQDAAHGALDSELVGRERRRDEGYRIVRSRQLSAQVRASGELAPALQHASHEAAREGLRSLTAFGRTTPDPDVIAARVAARMREAQVNTLARLAAEHGRVVEHTLARANAERLPAREAAQRVNEALREQAWQLERIAATEASFAFNCARQEAMTEWGREERGLYKRWTEKITDAGRPMDKRVAIDSVVLHAQVVRPSAMFKMPEDNRVDAKWWGREWEFPPNRPFDRSVITPWRRGDRQPAWTLRGGRRVSL